MSVLLSVHVPKTAGNSFRIWLETVYGTDQIFLDYSDKPADPVSLMNIEESQFLELNKHVNLPHGKTVVHGHFWIEKYRFIKDSIKIAFLRDPVERIISHYFFWLKMESQNHTLHRKFLEESPSIIEFSKYPCIRYFYTNIFFRNVDMSSFKFIGILERYNDEIKRLERILNVNGEISYYNKNPYKKYEEEKNNIINDSILRKKIEDIVIDDMKFYEKWAGF